ncbi:hypothetical protein EDD17DRAFT_901782 [Pisolithus thermaeus]|nr:hypothetical protein EDD17DRAFT_901782 [Pisolithus thermaeus]
MITLPPLPRSVNCLHFQVRALIRYPQVLQLSGGPIIPIPPLAHSSDLAGHPSGELHVCRFPSISPSSHCAFRAHGHWAIFLVEQSVIYRIFHMRCVPFMSSSRSRILPRLNHTCGYWDMQGHGSGYVTNLTYAIGQSPGYQQESGDVSTFGDWGNSLTGLTMNLGSVFPPLTIAPLVRSSAQMYHVHVFQMRSFPHSGSYTCRATSLLAIFHHHPNKPKQRLSSGSLFQDVPFN